MAITNYTELQTRLQDEIDDSEADGKYTEFITQAEQDIKADLDLVENQAISTADTSTTSHYLEFPNFFSSPIRMHINGTNEQYPITFVTPDALNSHWSPTPQRPEYVAVVDGQFEFNSTPDQVYEVELLYNQLTPLSGGTLTNEVFPEFLNAYLYGALKYAAIYLKEFELQVAYGIEYEKTLKKLEMNNKRKRFPSPLKARSKYGKRR